MNQRLSVFGLGYVGSVTAACLAQRGNTVIGVDPNATKVDMLKSGKSPIVEAGLEDLIREAKQKGLLTATTDPKEAVLNSDISFISVGTPSMRNGRLELAHVEAVCKEIGEALRSKSSFHWIVLRSTALPGTTESLVIPTIEKASGKQEGRDFGVCFNPEFLREGTAVADFNQPPMTVLGTNSPAKLAPVRELYAWATSPRYETAVTTAEMVKYVCNAFHALKVAFANEIGSICAQLDIEAKAVMDIFKADTRLNISTAYLTPGFAFGGSCLPKDLRALTYRAKELDLQLPLITSIMPSNTEHVQRAVDKILATNKRRIGVIGLSFKPGTDDLRESPIVHLVKRLLGEGCEIMIYDHNVSLGRLMGSNRQFIEDTIPHIGMLLSDDIDQVLQHGDVIVLGMKGLEEKLATLTPDQVVIDLVSPHTVKRPQAAEVHA
jgi:GDP-mannose 6-dehydrogenase